MSYIIKPKNKYRAVKVKLDGYTFDSKREAAVYQELKILKRAGKIKELVVHPEYDLMAGFGIVGQYEADFSFFDNEQDRYRVVDVKGFDTPLSKWKRRHLKAQEGIEVEIVK